MAVVGESIQQCCCQLGIAEYVGPFREAQVGGDDQAGLFVQFAQQVKQQGTANLAERQVPELIEDEQIDVHQPVGQASLLAVELFLLKRINKFNGG